MPPPRLQPAAFAFLATLKFKVVIGCIAAALAASAGTTHFVLRTTEDHTRRLLLDHGADSIERNAQRLAGSVQLLHRMLGSAAARVDDTALSGPEIATHFLLGHAGLNQLFDSVFLARADGTLLSRIERGVPGSQLPNLADREYFQRAIATGLPVVSEPLIGRVSGVALVMHAVPVRSAQGQVVGVVGGALRLDANTLDLLPDATAHESDAIDLVMSAEGVVLAHTDASRVTGRANIEPGLVDVYKRWHLDGRTIHAEGVARLSDGRLVSMAGVPTAGWMLVRISSEAETLRPLTAARATAWRVAAAVAGAAALFAGVLAWLLTRPITALRNRAEQLLDADGGGAAPWPDGGGEVGALSAVLRHVVDQVRQRELEAKGMLRRLEAVIDNADLGVAFTRSGQFELVSRSLAVMFGREVADMAGARTRILYPSDEAFAALSARARPAFMDTGGFDGECEVVRADGAAFWVHMRGRAIEPGNLAAGTIWIFEDVTDARDARERLTWNANHDALTGLVNRAAFEAQLEAACRSSAHTPFCALFIDLDRFKQVNDTAGHAAGDQVLRDLAHALGRTVRASDIVARLGGDEFAVLLAGCPRRQAQQIAEKLRLAVESYTLDWEGTTHAVGASIGLVEVTGQFAGGADALRAADAACYAAKRGGRNRVAEHA